MCIRGILFDFDGTLVDSEPVHCQLWQQLLRPYSVALSKRDYQTLLLGTASTDSAALLVETFALPISAQNLMQQREIALQAQLLEAPPALMPYARKTLEHYRKQGFRLALVTASGRQAVHNILCAHGLQDLFEVITTGDDIRHSKPHPEGYCQTLQRLGLKPHQGVAIEDSATGIQAALTANLRCLGIKNPYGRPHECDQATHVFDHLGEVCRWIDSNLLTA
ncbi:MAG: HAD family phosphatase [Motiliproteus sp.]